MAEIQPKKEKKSNNKITHISKIMIFVAIVKRKIEVKKISCKNIFKKKIVTRICGSYAPVYTQFVGT